MWVLRKYRNRIRDYFGNFFTLSLIIPGNFVFTVTNKPTNLLAQLWKASLRNIPGITDGNLNMIINFTHRSRVCDKEPHWPKRHLPRPRGKAAQKKKKHFAYSKLHLSAPITVCAKAQKLFMLLRCHYQPPAENQKKLSHHQSARNLSSSFSHWEIK